MREYSLWNTADIIGSISYKIHYFFLVLQYIIICILKLRNRHKICFDLTYYSIVVEMHHNYLWHSIEFLVFFWYFYPKQIPLIRRPMTMPFSRATWHNYASSRKGKGKFWNLNRMLTIRNTRASHTERERERDKCMRILLAVTVSGRVGCGLNELSRNQSIEWRRLSLLLWWFVWGHWALFGRADLNRDADTYNCHIWQLSPSRSLCFSISIYVCALCYYFNNLFCAINTIADTHIHYAQLPGSCAWA